jgi:YVTN family beta-propeller protein
VVNSISNHSKECFYCLKVAQVVLKFPNSDFRLPSGMPGMPSKAPSTSQPSCPAGLSVTSAAANITASLYLCCKNADCGGHCKKQGQAPLPYGPKEKLICCQCPTGEVLNENRSGCVPVGAPSSSPSSKSKRTGTLPPSSNKRTGTQSPSTRAKRTSTLSPSSSKRIGTMSPSTKAKRTYTLPPATRTKQRVTLSPSPSSRLPTSKPTRSPTSQPTESTTVKPTSKPSMVAESVRGPPPPSLDTPEPAPLLTVVNGGDSTLSVIDGDSDMVIRTVKLDRINYPHHASVSPDMSKIVIGVPGMDLSGGHGNIMMNMGGKFVVLDSTTFSPLKTVKLPSMNHNAAFSPDGSEIWTAQMVDDGTVLVYDAVTYALKNTIKVGMMPLEVSFSADKTTAFVCVSQSATVVMIDVKDKTVMKTLEVGTHPVGAWPGSNNLMYVDNEASETITIIDAATKSIVGTIELKFAPGMAAYNKLDNSVWVTDGTTGAVAIYDSAGRKFKSIKTGKGAHGIIFNENYSKAYITNQMSGTVSVIDTGSRMKIKDINVGSKPNGLVSMMKM